MNSKNVDKFSMLPESIRTYILSLMPTKLAVRTSLLSKGWRYSWTLVTNIDFDDDNTRYGPLSLTNHVDAMNQRLRTFVDRKFSVTSQVDLFRLRFDRFSVERSTLSNWISEAVRLNVRELDINVRALELPLSLFTSKTLTKLRLRWKFDDYIWECPSSVDLPSLKMLDIYSADPLVNAFKLISGCPMLESLSLEVSSDNGKEDYIFNLPTLKRLNLTLLGRSVKNKVVLHVPNLEYLSVWVGTLRSPYVMENVSSLVEASVTFYEIRHAHLLVEFLEGVREVESFSIHHNTSISHLSIFPNMKHLVLDGWWQSREILQVLERCPRLKHLYLTTPASCGWIEPKFVPTCILTNLTTIKFPIWGGYYWDKKLLEYMLGNGEVLKKVTITWKDFCVESRMSLTTEVFKFPRASKCCEIDFQGSMSQYCHNPF